MPRGRKKGQTSTLYSVWRNSDDKLMILDGTAEECCEIMGINKNSFYRLVCAKSHDYGAAYSIRKIKRSQVTREGGS